MTLKQYLFEANRSPIFIETGTSVGGGVELAVSCGYDRIFSIESNQITFRSVQARFDGEPRVILLYGDSSFQLSKLLEIVHEPCTFWLDAHDVEMGTCAALDELAVIEKDPIKTHTIMIDDWEDFGTPKHGNISKESIIEALRRINPEYRIACYYGEVGAPNVLVAKV